MSPLVGLLVIAAPLVALAYFGRIFPRASLVWLAMIPGALSLGLIFFPWAFSQLLLLDAVLVLVAAADLLSLPSRATFFAERESGRSASLAKPHAVGLTIGNRAGRQHRVWVRDDLPTDLEAEPDGFDIPLRAGSRSTVHYQIRARRRGSFEQSKIYLRVLSRLTLWQRSLVYPVASTLHVYPDMQQLAKYAVLARTNRLSLLGVRRTRKLGQDNEFERLRDFTLDDNYKFIDWRSTARRGKLTVKDFQANQSQRLLFLVDCGRMMSNVAAGISLLDHALNSMLLLSFVALRQGDAVGLIAFSDEIHNYVPPRSGMQQMNRLLHAAYDRFPRLVESRYDEAFLYLGAHCRKRSLVVLLTNVIDEVNSNQVEQYLSNLAGRHLPLCVMLRDHQLFDAVDASTDNDTGLYRAAAAAQILTWRRQTLRDLQSKGVLSLDVFPEQLTAPLVNRYLDIKARHLL